MIPWKIRVLMSLLAFWERWLCGLSFKSHEHHWGRITISHEVPASWEQADLEADR